MAAVYTMTLSSIESSGVKGQEIPYTLTLDNSAGDATATYYNIRPIETSGLPCKIPSEVHLGPLYSGAGTDPLGSGNDISVLTVGAGTTKTLAFSCTTVGARLEPC